MGKPKAPKAPDPYQVAGADYAYNNPSQYTPWGSLVNTAPTINNGQVTSTGTSTLNLSPELQQIFNSQIGVSQASLDEAQKRQAQLGNLPEVPSSIDFGQVRGLPTDFSADRANVEQAYFNRGRGLLDPIFAERERGLRGTMADQGLPAGSEARNYDLGQFYDSQNRAYGDLANQSVLAGGQEQSRMFGLTNTARQQDIADQLQQINLAQSYRGNQFNELQALLGQQQVATPGLQNFYQPRGADLTGAYGLNLAAQNAAYGGQNDLFGGMLGGLFNLGSAAITKYSDVRLKTEVRRVGITNAGIPIYTYRYHGDPQVHMGVMAQELEKTQPEAVREYHGFKRVDYGRVR